MESTAITPETISSHGLTKEEYNSIIKYLGRKPNLVELGIFSVMWSEHCSYKSSKIYLKKFPTKGRYVVQGPGENAGVVDIGDGLVAVFKMESHNHPSFIEPYQGAATGVGGILRDVFTMGARPVALLNSLRFGDPNHPKTKFLIEAVISGIAGYGNCFGCPTVGGEVYFHESYNLNPLVNAFCLGIAESDKIFLGRAEGIGNPVIYVGSKTGRDGIHGATMASQEFDDNIQSRKPNVQVGDPFCEKLLLEACLEVMKSGDVVGIQDMGAAGLTSSSVEMASRAGCGIRIDLSKVPPRETQMTPYEFLLSESQERMLLVVQKGSQGRVQKIFEKWDLDMAEIGYVTKDKKFRAIFQGKEVACIPIQALTDKAPKYKRPLKALKIKHSKLNIPCPKNLGDVMKKLITSHNLCSKKWVYRQYDHQVRGDSVILPGGDAALIRVKGMVTDPSVADPTQKGLAMTTDCNSRYCHIDPYQGAQMAVCEASRNLACVGAKAIGLTDCLNFGNPEKKEVMWQFKRAVEGISSACRALKIPVVSGNVSFYNDTEGKSIYPTPTIGMVGLLKNIENRMTHFFKNIGDQVIVLGEKFDNALGGSQYASYIHGKEEGQLPKLNILFEKKVQECVRMLILKKYIESAHDISEGGLAITLLEACFEKNLGVRIRYMDSIRPDIFLFGESPSRIVISIKPQDLKKVEKLIQHYQIPYIIIGEVIPDAFIFNDDMNIPIHEVKRIWENSFEKLLQH